jgi:hypothetical protein
MNFESRCRWKMPHDWLVCDGTMDAVLMKSLVTIALSVEERLMGGCGVDDEYRSLRSMSDSRSMVSSCTTATEARTAGEDEDGAQREGAQERDVGESRNGAASNAVLDNAERCRRRQQRHGDLPIDNAECLLLMMMTMMTMMTTMQMMISVSGTDRAARRDENPKTLRKSIRLSLFHF